MDEKKVILTFSMSGLDLLIRTIDNSTGIFREINQLREYILSQARDQLDEPEPKNNKKA